MNAVSEPIAVERPVPAEPGGALRLTRRIRRGLRRRWDGCIRKLGKDHHHELALVKSETEFGGARVLAGVRDRKTTFSSPVLYDQKLEIIRQPPLETTVPDLTLLELCEVTVVGGTMAVLRDGKLLHPELLHTKAIHDDKAADVCRFVDAPRTTVGLDAYTRFGGRPRIKVGIHLLKEHSANFYHWLFECLPRLLYFIENLGQVQQAGKFTLLIEDNLLPAAHDSLRRVISFPFEIETVRRGEMVHCDKLFYVSPFWYSLDNSKHRADPHHDYAVDKLAVQKIRDTFRPLMKTGPPTRRLFLPRAATQVRRISNTAEVEALMRKHDFEIIHPHLFSFAEQVALFSSAKVVIGASGAAFSNLVFMPPGAQAVIFSPKQLEVFNYYIFQQQADVAGVALAHLLAVPAKHDDFYVHDDFMVNCDDLQALIQSLTK